MVKDQAKRGNDVMEHNDCIFCKIINGEIPSAKVFENEHVLAFLDISQVSKGHTLVIPKVHKENVFELTPEIAQEIFRVGAGILMSTHILSTAERYCDAFIILHEGQVRAKGTLRELQQQFSMPHATLDDIYIQLTKEEQNV